VVVAVTHDAPGVEVRSLAGDEVERRVGAMLDYEWQRLASRYAQFRFAFPERTNPLLEERAARQRAALARLASTRDGLLVSHPSPAPIERLFERLRPCLAG
jgi:hypothetical protein